MNIIGMVTEKTRCLYNTTIKYLQLVKENQGETG